MAAGCVALKPLPEVGTEAQPCCEMKRLFVKPEARGHKAGACMYNRSDEYGRGDRLRATRRFVVTTRLG
eukprot:5631504-Pyramimonas_sp.AAC.1